MANKSKKPKLPEILEIEVMLAHVGGWTQGSLVACTYEQPLAGQVQVIKKTHLYHRMAGRDLYPTTEQFDALVAGQHVTFGAHQWA
jgi:hypothetical protein